MESMYPDLPPVEVGETLRYFEPGDPDRTPYYVKVTRLTKKLIYVDGLTEGCAFSREHGAYFDVGCFNAYSGYVRKLTPDDKPGGDE